MSLSLAVFHIDWTLCARLPCYDVGLTSRVEEIQARIKAMAVSECESDRMRVCMRP
jgi:hypothetical protein